jgi:hypothetical protein
MPAPTPASIISQITTTSGGTLTDASGGKWTLSSGGVVSQNGTAVPGGSGTASVALMNKVIYAQDAATKSWFTYSTTNHIWAASAAPVATQVNIVADQTSATISASHVYVSATSGNHMVFISGSGDAVALSGGNNKITDTGSGNAYVIPAAGKGYDTFTSNVMASGNFLDLRTALAATNWNHASTTLSAYLSVTNTTAGAVLSIAPTSGGIAAGIATINGATGSSLSSLLAHALT